MDSHLILLLSNSMRHSQREEEYIVDKAGQDNNLSAMHVVLWDSRLWETQVKLSER